MTAAPETLTATRRPRSPRGKGDLLRDEILAAAEQILIASKDESALSIRAIAAAVGVTPPSIYLHFADRTELVFAVIERQAEKLQQAMSDAAAGVDDPWDRLRNRGYAYLTWGLANPEQYRVLMMTRPDATPERFVDERLADTAGLIPVTQDLAAAVERGQIIDPGEPLITTEMLWMVMHGMVSLLISKPGFPFGDPDDLFDRMFDLVRSGLVPRA